MSPFSSPHASDTPFGKYLARWRLVPDGLPLKTCSSHLLPVLLSDGAPGMLKISHHPEETQGGHLMTWWNGAGAAHVFAHDNTALLLERATGSRSLTEMSRTGSDSEASRILCTAAATLQVLKRPSPPRLTPLTEWFRELRPVALDRGGILRKCLRASQALLDAPQDVVILHGDLHHGNILDAGAGGWVAIDPKGLIGERGFEFANMFCNPDKEIGTALGRLAMQSSVVAVAAHMERARLLQWILAYAGLSAAWSLNSSEDPDLALAVAQAAAAERAKS